MNKENAEDNIEIIEDFVKYIQTATLWFWAGSGCLNQTGAIVAIIGGFMYLAWTAIRYFIQE